MIVIETHRTMGVDTSVVPDGTKLFSPGNHGFTVILTKDSKLPVRALGCTVPGGYLKIYGRSECLESLV